MCLVFDVQMQALEMVSSLLIIIARLEGLLTSNSGKAGICNFVGRDPETELRAALEKAKYAAWQPSVPRAGLEETFCARPRRL